MDDIVVASVKLSRPWNKTKRKPALVLLNSDVTVVVTVELMVAMVVHVVEPGGNHDGHRGGIRCDFGGGRCREGVDRARSCGYDLRSHQTKSIESHYDHR